MSLASDASELVEVLKIIHSKLENFNHSPAQDLYVHGLAHQVKPLVVNFELAVKVYHSRGEAQNILSKLQPILHEAACASSKGEMHIFNDSSFDRYADLCTIFRESRYSNENL